MCHQNEGVSQSVSQFVCLFVSRCFEPSQPHRVTLKKKKKINFRAQDLCERGGG